MSICQQIPVANVGISLQLEMFFYAPLPDLFYMKGVTSAPLNVPEVVHHKCVFQTLVIFRDFTVLSHHLSRLD